MDLSCIVADMSPEICARWKDGGGLSTNNLNLYVCTLYFLPDQYLEYKWSGHKGTALSSYIAATVGKGAQQPKQPCCWWTINQPINQSINQSIDRSVNWVECILFPILSCKRFIQYCVRWWIDKSIKQPINQSMIWQINQQIDESVD